MQRTTLGIWCSSLVLLAVGVSAPAQDPKLVAVKPAPQTLADAAIRKILVERIDARRQGVGLTP